LGQGEKDGRPWIKRFYTPNKSGCKSILDDSVSHAKYPDCRSRPLYPSHLFRIGEESPGIPGRRHPAALEILDKQIIHILITGMHIPETDAFKLALLESCCSPIVPPSEQN